MLRRFLIKVLLKLLKCEVEPSKCKVCINESCKVVPISGKCEYDPRYVPISEEK